MNEFKLDDGTMGKILYIYHNYLLYTKDNYNNIYAAKYEIINKQIILNEVNDQEIDLIINKYQKLGSDNND